VNGVGTSSVSRREILSLVFFSLVSLISGLEVARFVGQEYSQGPRGLSYHLFFTVGDLLGFSPEGAVVFAATLVFGLFLLMTADRYRRFNGLVLLLVSVGGVLLMNQAGIARVDWFAHGQAAGLGLVSGVVGGGITVRGGPGHDVFKQSGTVSRLEFPKVVPRLFNILFVVGVTVLVESLVVYDSPLVYRAGDVVFQPFAFIAPGDGQWLYNAFVVTVFLGTVWWFKDATADREVTILGATGTGKTATMAGLAMSVDDYSDGDYDLNRPLQELRRELDQEGLFRSTDTEAVPPLQMTFKHGRLLPRKVTVRAVDYAGNHIENFEPIDAKNAATADIDEAFDVATYMYNKPDEETEGGQSDQLVDGKNPDEVPELEELDNDQEIILQLLHDIVAYSDSVALLYPMDDFAEEAVAEGNVPAHVDIDGTEVETPRAREDYVESLRQVARKYRTEKDVFAVGTKADIVKRHCEVEHGVDTTRDWDEFGDTIGNELIDTSTDDSLQDKVIPVHFEVEGREGDDDETDDEGRGETILKTDDGDGRYPLRGAGHLLDRMGNRQLDRRLGGD
jgi:hypothetical protein